MTGILGRKERTQSMVWLALECARMLVEQLTEHARVEVCGASVGLGGQIQLDTHGAHFLNDVAEKIDQPLIGGLRPCGGWCQDVAMQAQFVGIANQFDGIGQVCKSNVQQNIFAGNPMRHQLFDRIQPLGRIERIALTHMAEHDDPLYAFGAQGLHMGRQFGVVNKQVFGQRGQQLDP